MALFVAPSVDIPKTRNTKSTYYALPRTEPSMKRDLLSYYQEVLDKISQADARTFRKEMRKAFKRLLPEEREQLKVWFRSACVCRIHPDPSHPVVDQLK